jgi:putative transposase
MRVSIAEKEEIIQLVERSELGVGKTLQQLGIHKGTYYRWYHAYLKKGTEGVQPVVKPIRRKWNTIPDEQKQLVLTVALEFPNLSPRELAVKLTDEQKIFISESSVYRILKTKGLITSPAHILLSAASEFKEKTAFVHQMWQTDFTLTSKSWAGVGIT